MCKGKYKTTSFICSSKLLSVHPNSNMRDSSQSVWCLIARWTTLGPGPGGESHAEHRAECRASLELGLLPHRRRLRYFPCSVTLSAHQSLKLKGHCGCTVCYEYETETSWDECAVNGYPEGRRFKPQTAKITSPTSLATSLLHSAWVA